MTEQANPTVRQASDSTLAKFGREMEINHLLNWRLIAQSAGVKDWREKFYGIPAIVLGAGPSLTQAIPHLKDLEQKALLISTDRALKPLIEAGIRPHVTVSADMEAVLMKLYEGFDIPADLVLLYDRDAYHPLIHDWKGPRLTYDTYFDMGVWSRMFVGTKGFLHKNLSVSHTAFYLANLAGCSPIILAGVDNAFPAPMTHAEGVAQVDGGVVDPAHPSWITIEGVKGPVRSSPGFNAMARAFEDALVEAQCHLISTTPEGAKIEGAEWMPIEDAIAGYCHDRWNLKDLVRDCVSQSLRGFDDEAFERHHDALIPELEAIINMANQGVIVLREAERIDRAKHGERFLQKLIKADQYRVKMTKSKYIQTLMGKMMFRTVFLSEHMDRDIQELARLDPKRLWTEAAKLELLFSTAQQASLTFMECLNKIRGQVSV